MRIRLEHSGVSLLSDSHVLEIDTKSKLLNGLLNSDDAEKLRGRFAD